ncbi:hypothetical protein HJC23_010689 [Cyclotella cryptica]|uniref:Uncharacterized protein n=1 Tax=Cyclotella cryptica TaxID=29204 RepID=A0ABD3P8Y6_9STRA|eukprot:CCRYP_016497-RA/>CCRYP_016497-RA protein AED:0.35 eAED:0.35 QI:0/-1/0/1/-1/1/1/0/296
MALRSFDAFAKPLDGTRQRSLSGGCITVLASATAALLFLSQLFLYIRIETRHSMHLADSVPSLLFDKQQQQWHQHHNLSGHSIPLHLHITFPHLPCGALDYAHDGNSYSTGKFGHYHPPPYTLTARVPTASEYKTATSGGYAEANIASARRGGCTLVGTIRIPRVGGTISVSVSGDSWIRVTSLMSFGVDFSGLGNVSPDPFHGKLPNVTHYLHDVTFGEPFPRGKNPLRGVHHVMDNGSGVALANVAVKLVPTTYKEDVSFGEGDVSGVGVKAYCAAGDFGGAAFDFVAGVDVDV